MTNNPECKKCESEDTIKYGQGRNHSQRYLCHDCKTTFTPEGKRGTYSRKFIEEVNEEYCHENKTAKEVVKKFGISTRTLIKRKKQHQSHCDCGDPNCEE